jgi:hypothetical protein
MGYTYLHGLLEMVGDVYAEDIQAEGPLQRGWLMRNIISKMAADFTKLSSFEQEQGPKREVSWTPINKPKMGNITKNVTKLTITNSQSTNWWYD